MQDVTTMPPYCCLCLFCPRTRGFKFDAMMPFESTCTAKIWPLLRWFIWALNHYKQQIFSCRPTTIISIVTIPMVSFAKFKASKHLSSPLLSAEELDRNQRQIDLLLDQANARIREFNSVPQLGVITRTLSWHTAVRKPSKRKTRSGRYNTCLRNDFSQLYDGLHAKPMLKRRWFNELLKSFEIDKRHLSVYLEAPQ